MYYRWTGSDQGPEQMRASACISHSQPATIMRPISLLGRLFLQNLGFLLDTHSQRHVIALRIAAGEGWGHFYLVITAFAGCEKTTPLPSFTR
jgi:hypothetical protein